jgi:hypothetical protein
MAVVVAAAEKNNTKRITLSISQIAPLIGIDNYNNFPRIFCEIWRRYNPEEFRSIELKLKESGAQLANASEMNDIWEIDEQLGTNLLEQVKALNENKDKSSNEMVKMQDDITKYINKQTTLTDIQKTELAKKVCSITNKNHGVNNEDAILKEFCNLTEKTLQNSQGWVEIPLINDEFANWVIIGKYDGITTENELVEAKMRQKALFKKMRDYENVQVQLYLHALEYQQGFLIEGITANSKTNTKPGSKNTNTNTNTTTGTMQVYIHEIQYNDEYVKDFILERLKKFIAFFEIVMKDEEKKINLLKGDSKREIYNYYQEEFLGIVPIEF